MKDPVCSTLEGNGVHTIGELINYSRDDLLKIPKLGQTKINHIEERLKVFGLHLNLRWEN
jgi:DNA-directed RNA polymerase subunit alpha